MQAAGEGPTTLYHINLGELSAQIVIKTHLPKAFKRADALRNEMRTGACELSTFTQLVNSTGILAPSVVIKGSSC